MARGIQIPFTLNPRDFLKGLRRVEVSLDDVVDALDKVEDSANDALDDIDARAAERALDDVENAAEDAADGFDELRREADQSLERVEDDAKQAGDAIERKIEAGTESAEASFAGLYREFDRQMDRVENRAGQTGQQIPDDLRTGQTGIKAVGAEYGQEFTENFGEGVRSGDMAGVVLETFTQSGQVIGQALRGPQGIAAGLGIAAIAGIINGIEARKQAMREALAGPVEDALDEAVDEAVEGGQRVADAYVDALDADVSGRIEGLVEALAGDDATWTQAVEQIDGWADAIDKAGLSTDDLILALAGTGDAQREAAQRFVDAQAQADSTRITQQEYGNTLQSLTDIITGQTGVLDENRSAASLAQQAVDVLADAEAEAAVSAEDMAGAIDDAADAVAGLGDEFAGQDEAVDNYRQQILDTASAVEELTADGKPLANGLDVTSQAGLDAKDTLRELASSALDAAAAQIELDGDTEAARRTTEEARRKFIETAGQLGLSEQAAEDYARELGLVPDKVSTSIVTQGLSGVLADIDNYTARLNAINGTSYSVEVVQNMVTRGNYGPANDYPTP